MGSRPRGNDAENGETLGAQLITEEKLLALLRTSLALWRIDATVTRTEDERVLITFPDGSRVIVARAPPAIPFRWMVTTATGRERPASSITGLLRVLRSTLDPDWRPGRARVVPLTVPQG